MKLVCILLSAFFCLCSISSKAQRITVSELQYQDHVYRDTTLNDSTVQAAVRTLFSESNEEVQQVLYDKSDTAFYTALKSLIYIVQFPDWYEVNLYNVVKDGKGYMLTCFIQWRVPGMDIVNVVGFVDLPFVVVDGQVLFKNYFLEKSVPGMVKAKNLPIYTTANNKGKLDSIAEYVSQVSNDFAIPYDRGKKLYYIYLSADINPHTMLGINNYPIGDMGQVLKVNDGYLIVDKKGNGFYRHELVHYLTSDTITTKFFNEGLASYIAGSSSNQNQLFDYTKLLGLLTQNTSDTVFLPLIKDRWINNTGYLYQLASFTVYLIEKKYGECFYTNPKVRAILNATPEEILRFINQRLKPKGVNLHDYYLSEVRKWLANR